MTGPRDDARVGRLLRAAFVASMGVLLLVGALQSTRAAGTDPARPDIFDFHVFALVGRLAAEGRLAEAYRASTMLGFERALGGRDVFMPYGYPPLYGLVLAPSAALPVWAAFLAFTAGSAALYVAALRRLAGPWFWTSLLVASPAVLIDIRLGQNGLLTAGLAALSASLAQQGRGREAGAVAGGLAALKPHVAVGLPIVFLVRRDARAAAATAVVAVALSGVAAAWFGLSTIAAFRDGLSEMSRFMAAGLFPLHRMTSVYACLLSLGAPAPSALAAHAIVACGVVATSVAVAARCADRRAGAGLPLMATAFVSPYFYDYDLTVFVAGLALALPALSRAMPGRRLDLLLVAVSAGELVGIVETVLIDVGDASRPSLGGPLLLTCFCVVAVVIQSAAPARSTAVVPAAVSAP